jgi:ABC-type multidrug transport system ATPase subunit
VTGGSYLVATEVLVPGAVLALGLWSYWITDRTLAYLTLYPLRDRQNTPAKAQVRRFETDLRDDPRDGLVVQDLTVCGQDGTPYLTAVSMQVEPGEVVGIIGESGTGKSLFLRALADPFSLTSMEISGAVHWDRMDFWERHAHRQRLQAVYLPDQPLLLPSSGAHNLACFQGEPLLDRGKWMLEQMVFAHDMVEQICATPNAQLLPSMQRQALALTRAFLLSPNIYLFDQPERALGDSQIAALSRRLDRETRLGRSVILVSDNRTLLEKCDRLYVLQDGRFVDYGPAEELRTRMAGGWARFIGKRQLSSEDTLEPWIRSHFRRDGDEGNRRKACIVASEMLALSCRNADPDNRDTVQFLFKHFEGHCLLHMIDADPPISSGQMQIAADLAQAKTLEARKNVLASIMSHCQELDVEGHLDGRILRAKIATYDPRKVKSSTGTDHGPQTR